MKNIQQIPLVLQLDDVSATLEQVGGKGASLARMANAGLPVPPGFYVTTAAYRRFVEANGLQEAILAAVRTANPDDPAMLEQAATRIVPLFAGGTMPDDIAEAIRQAYAVLGDGDLAVAVRSSATAEDLPGMSFAGQQETYLNMRGETRVLDAVKRCWASLWTARAISYRARQGIAPQDVSLAVVVEELVPADASGILFTADPMTGSRDKVMLNAAWGLGEAIVGGQVTPDTIVVDKATGAITAQEINDKEIMTVRTPEGTHEEPVLADRRKQAVLTATQAAELARVGVQIEQLYGQPMDIEWAIHANQLFVVQARPITTLPETPPTRAVTPEEYWALSNPKERYVRSSVNELLADPLSTLFATLGVPAWNKAMKNLVTLIEPTETWLARLVGPILSGMMSVDMLTTVRGYAYYDIGFMFEQPAKMLFATLGAIPLMFRVLGTARTRWERAHGAYEQIVKRWEATDLSAPPATQLFDGTREITTMAADYYLTIQSGFLPAAYLSEMVFTEFYNRLIKRRDDPPALTFLLGYDSAPIRAEQSLYDLAQWARGQPGLADALEHLSGTQFMAAYRGDDAGNLPATWSEFRQRFAAHLARFGHTIYDLDFAKAVPADDPAVLLETFKFFLSGEAPNPQVRQAKAVAAREQAVQTMLARLRGLRRSWFQGLVQWAQLFAPLREDGLADVGLGWPILRRMLHEIGSRLVRASALEQSDDVFWLTADELHIAVGRLDNGQLANDYHARVAERRATWESASKFTPPVALPIKKKITWLGMDLQQWLPARSDQAAGDVIKGIGASPGRVTGPARVIHGPDEFNLMKRGDILVAKITTPAWTSLFALASGVVTDVGGPLSHSSIVAREYHIPAVLGTGIATERIKSDQQVTVDGDAGTVKMNNA
jgi:phosphohistidine swiveling domain-containing protein